MENDKGGFVGGAERARRDARKRRYQPKPQSSNSSFANNKRRHDTKHSITPYPKSMKDILKTENLEWDIPKLMKDKCRISFFVLGYLSLSHPILVPILFSAMQLVARKSCLAQPNDCHISLPTVHSRSPSTCIFTRAFKFSCPSHAPPV